MKTITKLPKSVKLELFARQFESYAYKMGGERTIYVNGKKEYYKDNREYYSGRSANKYNASIRHDGQVLTTSWIGINKYISSIDSDIIKRYVDSYNEAAKKAKEDAKNRIALNKKIAEQKLKDSIIAKEKASTKAKAKNLELKNEAEKYNMTVTRLKELKKLHENEHNKAYSEHQKEKQNAFDESIKNNSKYSKYISLGMASVVYRVLISRFEYPKFEFMTFEQFIAK